MDLNLPRLGLSIRWSQCRGYCTWLCQGSAGCFCCCMHLCTACTGYQSPSGLGQLPARGTAPWSSCETCPPSRTWKPRWQVQSRLCLWYVEVRELLCNTDFSSTETFHMAIIDYQPNCSKGYCIWLVPSQKSVLSNWINSIFWWGTLCNRAWEMYMCKSQAAQNAKFSIKRERTLLLQENFMASTASVLIDLWDFFFGPC